MQNSTAASSESDSTPPSGGGSGIHSSDARSRRRRGNDHGARRQKAESSKDISSNTRGGAQGNPRGASSGHRGHGGRKKERGRPHDVGSDIRQEGSPSEASRAEAKGKGGVALDPLAPAFVPISLKTKSPDDGQEGLGGEPSPSNNRMGRSVKSSAESQEGNVDTSLTEGFTELSLSIAVQLTSGKYECMVCFESIRRKDPVFNCEQCFAVFHLRCIRTWAKKSTEDGEDAGWRCPGCQHLKVNQELSYKCFCGKERNPNAHGYSYALPHSCGGVCGKMRTGTNCPHPCSLLCHPGPCPPCSALSPMLHCFCGKLDYRTRCSDLDSGRSCGDRCQKELDCEKHTCERICHEGSCDPCDRVESQKCFCGKETSMRDCGTGTEVDGVSYFSCGKPCGRELDCGKHFCESVCHAGECRLCALVPSRMNACPCGAHTLEELGAAERVSCLDPVQTCGGVCGKGLACGIHKCSKPCHTGDCGPCRTAIPMKCRCGSTVLDFDCHSVRSFDRSDVDDFLSFETPSGQSAELSAEFSIPVDPLKRAQYAEEEQRILEEAKRRTEAAEERLKKKNRGKKKKQLRNVKFLGQDGDGDGSTDVLRLLSEEEVAALPPLPFLCGKPCDRRRSCGRHVCGIKCCPSTAQGTVDVAGAHVCTLICGKKLKCGKHFCDQLCHSGHCAPCLQTIWTDLTCACGKTKIEPPIPCGTKPPMCSLPCPKKRDCGHDSPHLCHFGQCPACTEAHSAWCYQHHVQQLIPCSQESFSCGRVCGKVLSCGCHTCRRLCHGGPCLADEGDSGNDEKEDGGRKSCGQRCGAKRLYCPHFCEELCHPMCSCPEVACKVMVTVSCKCGRKAERTECGISGSRDGVRFTPEVECDDVCSSTARARAMADALGIVPRLEEEVLFGDFLAQEAIVRPDFVRKVEISFAELISSDKRTFSFPSMNRNLRKIIHILAEVYHLDSQSQDAEPNRNVIVFKTANSRVPPKLLSERSKVKVAAPLPLGNLMEIYNLTESVREVHLMSFLQPWAGGFSFRWLSDSSVVLVFRRVEECTAALKFCNREGLYDARPYQG